MSTVFNDIQSALDKNLNDMVGKPDVAWQNDGYEPTQGTTFIRPTLLPSETVGGTQTDDRHQGIYQVDMFVEAGRGKGALKTLEDLIGDQFKPVTELTYNGLLVRCMSVSILPARTEGAWYHAGIEVRYLSFTTKRI